MDIKKRMVMGVKCLVITSACFFAGLLATRIAEPMPFSIITDREYIQTNTWNGSLQFGGMGETKFFRWDCPTEDCIRIAYAIMHYARYNCCRPGVCPVCTIGSNNETEIAKLTMFCFDVQPTPLILNKGFNINDLRLRILPFRVNNSESIPSDMYCMLGAFFKDDEFCFAVYVNLNNGKISLNFREVVSSGSPRVASESRFPYLTTDECEVQLDMCRRSESKQ